MGRKRLEGLEDVGGVRVGTGGDLSLEGLGGHEGDEGGDDVVGEVEVRQRRQEKTEDLHTHFT